MPFLRMKPDFIKAAAAGLFLGPLAVWAAGMNGLAFGGVGWALALAGIAALPAPAARRAGREFLDEAKRLFAGSGATALIPIILGGAAAFSLLLSLVPPTAYESVSADLVLPQQYSFAHKVYAMPQFIPSLLPFTARAGYLWCFLLGGDWAGPSILNWAHALLACFLIARIGARAGLPTAASTGAAAVWMASPLVLEVSSTPLSYVQMSLYVLLALLALPGRGARGAVMAGLWAGAAATSRWGGWLVAPAAAAFLLVRPREAGRLRGVLVPAAVSLVPLAPLMAWNYLSAGGPFAPFFPASEQSTKLAAWFSDLYSFEKSILGVLVYPIQAAFPAAKFSQVDSSQAGGLLLGLYIVPFAFGFGRKWIAGNLAWPAFSALIIYAAYFIFDWPLAATPVVLGVCALLLTGAAGRLGKAGVPAAVAGLVLLGAFQSGYLANRAAEFVRAGGNTEAYLEAASEEFWPYPALKYIRENVPADSRILAVFESRIFYTQRRAVPALMQDRSALEIVLEESATARDVGKRFFQLGIGYVLVAEDINIKHLDQYIRCVKDREIQLLAAVLKANADLLYADPHGHCKVAGIGDYRRARGIPRAGPRG